MLMKRNKNVQNDNNFWQHELYENRIHNSYFEILWAPKALQVYKESPWAVLMEPLWSSQGLLNLRIIYSELYRKYKANVSQ